MFMMLMMMMNA